MELTFNYGGLKMIKVYSPTYNIGCFGFKFSDMIYFDFYYKNPSIGIYLRVGSRRYSITISGIRRWK